MYGWRWVAIGYGLLGLCATLLAVALRDASPLDYPTPWLHLAEPTRTVTSLVLGALLTVAVVSSTRVAVIRWDWARRLHAELRPFARTLSPPAIVLLAIFSSVGEELLFRGLLAPMIGVVAQGLVFGLAHQVRGPSRWVWVLWATTVGLLLGAVFAVTGSLAGALVAHAAINGINLRYLRAHDATQPKRRLGGILASSDV